MSRQLNLLTRERALAILKKPGVLDKEPKEVILDHHRWVHMWESGITRGNQSFLSKKELRKLHEILVAAMRNLRMDTGIDHDSPIRFEPMKLGSGIVNLINNREPVVLDPEFVSLVGSAVSNKPDPDDYDLLIRASKNQTHDKVLAEALPDGADIIHELNGPSGPYIPLYSLVMTPIESPGVKEPKFTIQPMSPIPFPAPGIVKNKETVRNLFEDSYFVVPVRGDRLMIHRKENTVIAYDAEQKEAPLPESF